MDDNWVDQLKEFPQLVRSKGRMLNLLKEKTKMGVKPKERKRYAPYMPDDERSSLISIQPKPPGDGQQPGGKKKIAPTVLENYDKGKDKDMGK